MVVLGVGENKPVAVVKKKRILSLNVDFVKRVEGCGEEHRSWCNTRDDWQFI